VEKPQVASAFQSEQRFVHPPAEGAQKDEVEDFNYLVIGPHG